MATITLRYDDGIDFIAETDCRCIASTGFFQKGFFAVVITTIPTHHADNQKN
jgi:hypothetical protein